jgi:hypothetical protein
MLNYFAHNGVEHATETEAVVHGSIRSLVVIAIISALVVIVLVITAKRLSREPVAKAPVNDTEEDA